jgi:hypothetical protein
MSVMEVAVIVDGQEYDRFDEAMRDIAKRMEAGLDLAAIQISQDLYEMLQLVAKRMAALHSNPWRPGGSPRDRLYRRSGGGLRSILETIRVKGRKLDQVQGQIGAAFPMAFHEEGGTIQARKSKYLTIPLPAALDAQGMPLKRRARDWKHTFVARSKRGNLLIFQKMPSGDILPLYVLKTSVRIPKRLGMEKAIDQQLPYFEAKAFDALEAEL